MKEIAVIGKSEELQIYNFCGIKNTFLIKNEEEAKSLINKLAKENFAIILVEEEIFEKIPEVVLKYEDEQIPSIVSLPVNLNKNLSNPEKKSNENFTYKTLKKLVGVNFKV